MKKTIIPKLGCQNMNYWILPLYKMKGILYMQMTKTHVLPSDAKPSDVLRLNMPRWVDTIAGDHLTCFSVIYNCNRNPSVMPTSAMNIANDKGKPTWARAAHFLFRNTWKNWGWCKRPRVSNKRKRMNWK